MSRALLVFFLVPTIAFSICDFSGVSAEKVSPKPKYTVAGAIRFTATKAKKHPIMTLALLASIAAITASGMQEWCPDENGYAVLCSQLHHIPNPNSPIGRAYTKDFEQQKETYRLYFAEGKIFQRKLMQFLLEDLENKTGTQAHHMRGHNILRALSRVKSGSLQAARRELSSQGMSEAEITSEIEEFKKLMEVLSVQDSRPREEMLTFLDLNMDKFRTSKGWVSRFYEGGKWISIYEDNSGKNLKPKFTKPLQYSTAAHVLTLLDKYPKAEPFPARRAEQSDGDRSKQIYQRFFAKGKLFSNRVVRKVLSDLENITGSLPRSIRGDHIIKALKKKLYVDVPALAEASTKDRQIIEDRLREIQLETTASYVELTRVMSETRDLLQDESTKKEVIKFLTLHRSRIRSSTGFLSRFHQGGKWISIRSSFYSPGEFSEYQDE